MKAYWHHLTYEFQAGLRNRILLFMNYALPLGFYSLMGVLMTKINPFFGPTMIPAMVLFAVLSACLLGLPSTLVTAREAGVYRTYRVNGVPTLSTLTIPVVAALAQTTVIAAAICLTAPRFFGASVPGNWLGFGLVTLAAVFAVSGIGILIGVISSSPPMTMLWSQTIYTPSMMLSGMMAPLELLPSGLGRAALLLPATHAMRAYRSLGGFGDGAPGGLWSLGVLFVGGLLALGLSLYLFSWDPRNTERRAPLWLAVLALLPYVLSAVLDA